MHAETVRQAEVTNDAACRVAPGFHSSHVTRYMDLSIPCCFPPDRIETCCHFIEVTSKFDLRNVKSGGGNWKLAIRDVEEHSTFFQGACALFNECWHKACRTAFSLPSVPGLHTSFVPSSPGL